MLLKMTFKNDIYANFHQNLQNIIDNHKYNYKYHIDISF